MPVNHRPRRNLKKEDLKWMTRALELASKSVGLCSPNPAVGCVITQGSQIAGEGFHEYDKFDHAEIVALRQAGGSARNATVYVTLEPCSRQGRTGPCVEALLAAGVRRVVAATVDPNPLIEGQGIRRLLASGVEVLTGVLQDEARRLNDSFARFSRTSVPYVTMKIAASLDGRIAGGPGFAKRDTWLTGEEARAEVHRMRHAADAILTGAGTILADDPLLTDRSGLPRRRPLLRVVLDSHLRTPLNSRLVATAQSDVLLFFRQAEPGAREALEAKGVCTEQIAGEEPGIAIQEVLKHLAARQIVSVLAEGGARFNSSLLGRGEGDSPTADRLVVFYAPKVLGADGVPMFAAAEPSGRLISGFPYKLTVKEFGRDIAIETCLRDPWSGVGVEPGLTGGE